MKEDKIWKDYNALPPELQRQVADFIAFLRTRSMPARLAKTNQQLPLTDEPFIGMWQDREDLDDSSAWVRNIRTREWMNRDA